SAWPARGTPGPVGGGCSQKSLSAVVWARIQRGTCSPTWSGLGFDKHLTLILLRVGHQATWGGSYSRNGQTFSSPVACSLSQRFGLGAVESCKIGCQAKSIPRVCGDRSVPTVHRGLVVLVCPTSSP